MQYSNNGGTFSQHTHFSVTSCNLTSQFKKMPKIIGFPCQHQMHYMAKVLNYSWEDLFVAYL